MLTHITEGAALAVVILVAAIGCYAIAAAILRPRQWPPLSDDPYIVGLLRGGPSAKLAGGAEQKARTAQGTLKRQHKIAPHVGGVIHG